MQKAVKITAVILVATMLLSGCMKTTNLKDLVVIEGMAIDRTDDINDKLELTIRMLNVAKSASNGEAPSGNMTMTISDKGESIVDMLSKMSKKVSRKLFFGQTKIIAFGDELARNGLEETLDYFLRSSDSRSDIAVCLSDSEAKKILESNENNSRVPCENILYLMKYGEEVGVSACITTEEILNLYYDKTSDFYLPIIKPDKKNISVQTAGIGVFDSDRLSGVLDDKETLGFLIMKNLVDRCIVEYEDERLGKTGVEFMNIKAENYVTIEKSEIIFCSRVKSDLVINEIEKGAVTKISESELERLRKEAEDELEKYCRRAFYACRGAGSDCLRVGKQLAKAYPEAYSVCEKDWKDYYSSVKISSSVSAEPKKIGDISQVE